MEKINKIRSLKLINLYQNNQEKKRKDINYQYQVQMTGYDYTFTGIKRIVRKNYEQFYVHTFENFR